MSSMNIAATIILENVGVWPLATTALVVLTAILLWFYPRQIREVGPAGWVLPLLRWCGFAVLAVMLLRPVLTQTAEKIASGQVIAIVDTSRSMGLVDSARAPAERVALARGFGMLPSGGGDEASNLLISHIRELDTYAQNVIRAQNDLEYARIVGRGVSAKQTAIAERASEYSAAAQSLIDEQTAASLDGLAQCRTAPPGDAREQWTALQQKLHDLEARAAKVQTTADEALYLRDANVRKICDELASQSRLALAMKALRIDRSALSTEASDLRGYSLGKDLMPLELDRNPRGANSDRLQPISASVDLGAGLGAAETLATELPARAIILLTDGHRGRQSDVPSAVRPSGVPVYPINVAASHISDAWISNISLSNTEVFRGQRIDGQVEVQFQGNVAPPTMLMVQGSGTSAPAPLRPRIRPDGKPSPNVLVGRFSIVVSPPPGAVDELLRFSVASEAGEATADNNIARRWIKVYSNKVRVTLVSGGPTWDVQNLQHLLQRMPWVELNKVTLPTPDAPLRMPPARLIQDDILVLHDVPVRALDASQWDAVGRMVSDRGGSVIIIAGTGAALSDYASQPLAAELLPFHDLHPVWRQWPGETGAFHFSPTFLGLGAAMGVGDPAENAQRWAETPNMFRYLQLPEKNLFADVHRWLTESDSGSPVITERQRGNGRLLFIGVDEMWRWAGRDGEPFDQRVWQQIIHYATGQRSAVSTPDVAFDIEHISIGPGGATRVRAWIRNAPAGQKSITVEVQSRGRPALSVVLNGAGNGRFEGTFTTSDAGDYSLRLRAAGRAGRGRAGDANVLATLPVHVASDDALGFVNLATDPLILEKIARASGGRALSLDQIDELPRILREVHVEDSQLARKPIYSSPLLMAFVLACLSAEWALRKRAGLA